MFAYRHVLLEAGFHLGNGTERAGTIRAEGLAVARTTGAHLVEIGTGCVHTPDEQIGANMALVLEMEWQT